MAASVNPVNIKVGNQVTLTHGTGYGGGTYRK
jgi:hypothetical protein